MTDASYRLELQRLVEDSREIELQFRQDVNGGRPVAAILERARKEAAGYLAELIRVEVSIDTVGEVQKLQNGVRRFYDLLHWCAGILAEGRLAEHAFEVEAQEDLESLRTMLADELGPEVSPEEVGLSREGVDA